MKEDAQIRFNKRISLKEEKIFLMTTLEQTKKRQQVFLWAECEHNIVGTTGISLRQGRQNCVGEFGITIRKDYRGKGSCNSKPTSM